MHVLVLKSIKYLVFSIFLLGLSVTAEAKMDTYVVGAYPIPDAEIFALYSAMERGKFTEVGVNLKWVDAKVKVSNALLARGDIDAHVNVAYSFRAQEQGFCTKVILPFTTTLGAALMGTVPSISELSGATVAISGIGGLQHSLLRDAFEREKKIDPTFVTPKYDTGGRSLDRLQRMLVDDAVKGAFVYEPFLALTKNLSGTYPIIDSSMFPRFPSSGLVVRCEDLNDPKKAAVHRRVVEVILAEVKWLHNPQNKEMVLAELEKAMGLKKFLNRFKGKEGAFAGRNLEKVSVRDLSESIYALMLRVQSDGQVSNEELQRAVSLVLKRPVSPEEVSTFFDLRFIPQKQGGVKK